MLLRNLHHNLLLEQRPARRPKRTIRHHVDPLLLGKLHHIILRQRRVILNLVHRRHRFRHLQQLLQVSHRVVAHADRSRLFFRQRLHLLPRVRVVVAAVADDVALAVGQLGEFVVVAGGVHQQWPVHEEEVDVVEAKGGEGLFEAEGHAGVVSCPGSVRKSRTRGSSA